MTWKEEHAGRKICDYPNPYEYRRHNQWQCYPNEDDGYTKVISYFTPKLRGQKYDVTGKVFVPKEFDHDIEFCAKKAIDMLTDRIYTSKLTKGRRRTLRKSFEVELEQNQYQWISLINYLRQAFLEGSTRVLLSRREIAMLQKPLTKKQERDKRLSRSMINY